MTPPEQNGRQAENGSDDGHLPQWGRMRSEGSTQPESPGPPAPDAEPRTDPRDVAARRRAVRGLSFALVLLGILLASGMAAMGHPFLGAVGVLPALVGLSGFMAVHLGIPRPLRPTPNPPPHPGRAWWWLPVTLLAMGLAAILGAFVADASAPATGSSWTMFWLVAGATLLTAAGLGFGLVAVSRLSVTDDDDAPLRRVDWSQEYPRRYADSPRHPGGFYDSSWITRDASASHSRKNNPDGDRDDP